VGTASSAATRTMVDSPVTTLVTTFATTLVDKAYVVSAFAGKLSD